MGDMNKVVGAVIGICVSVICAGTILVPQIQSLTGEGGALAEYSALLSAVVVMVILAILMIAVRLIQKD